MGLGRYAGWSIYRKSGLPVLFEQVGSIALQGRTKFCNVVSGR